MLTTKHVFSLVLAGVTVYSFGIHHVSAELNPVFQEIGKISVSVDAEGNNDIAGGTIQVDKPQGTTVKKAFMLASSFSGRVIEDGDVSLAGTPVVWSLTEANSAFAANDDFFYSVFADVTEIVKPAIDAAPTGILDLTVVEQNTDTIDGTILVVIFDNPNVTEDQSVILLFGAQSTGGDIFYVDFTEPLDATTEQIDMGLGIGYSYQNTSGTNQVNIIDVNDMRLTSSAGGEDDGGSYDGALITVGGIGDSNDNPEPNDPSGGFDSDDELYDLLPFINTGDKQIKVFSQNPSNDDNIFFSYFLLSESAAILPLVDIPQARELRGNLDPALPTIILTHGLQPEEQEHENLWTGTSETQATGLLENVFGTQAENVNIVQYIWGEAFTPHGWFDTPNRDAYLAAQRNTPEAGARLARILSEELGTNYNQPIHFIGHSLGTAVNAYATHHIADIFENVSKLQFTALDRPHHISGVGVSGGGIPGISLDDEEKFGYDDTFFASLLPMNRDGLDLRIDNYYAINGAGVGERAEGQRVYNHPELIEPNDIDDNIIENEGVSNNHSGVHQWYRWTMRSNDPFPAGATVCDGSEFAEDRQPSGFSDTLNPCQKGWYWSVNNQDVFTDVEDWRWPGYNGNVVTVSTPEIVEVTEVESFGCDYTGQDATTVITCTEQSSPYIMADIDIPAGSRYLSFDYRFTNPGDGDYAAVLIDNIPVWVMSGESSFSSEFVDSGKIPISGFEGERKLTVALYGVNELGAEFQIKNFRVYSVEVTTEDDMSPATDLETQIAVTKMEYGGEDILSPVTADAGDGVAPLLLSELKESSVDLINYVPTGILQRGQSKKLKMKFKFLETAGNEYQYAAANVKFKFLGSQ
ncbi:hypothetical protein N8083_01325 [Candidatus Pacebacteria bacterium]|nr:hypothetical protein [Candidatus Paceibacterota bacterium]